MNLQIVDKEMTVCYNDFEVKQMSNYNMSKQDAALLEQLLTADAYDYIVARGSIR